MKPDIHPDYRQVVFLDNSVNPPYKVLTRSTSATTETIEWEDGNTYPLIRVEISSASHPFYTGKMKFLDTAGMVDKYRRRWGIKGGQGEEAPAEEAADASSDS